MFEQSLLEIAARRSARKPWAVCASAVFQCFLVGLMIFIPLLSTNALPRAQLLVRIEPPPPPPGRDRPKEPSPRRNRTGQSELLGKHVIAPANVPDRIANIEDLGPPPANFSDPAPTHSGLGGPGTVPGGLYTGAGLPQPPPPAPERTQPYRVGGSVQSAKAISRPSPIYPPLARQARIQGVVRLEAIISKGGTIESLRVLSGHPLLVQAALDAVKQWLYRPTLLNREPVEVLTTIEVNFTLSQ